VATLTLHLPLLQPVDSLVLFTTITNKTNKFVPCLFYGVLSAVEWLGILLDKDRRTAQLCSCKYACTLGTPMTMAELFLRTTVGVPGPDRFLLLHSNNKDLYVPLTLVWGRASPRSTAE
jgi:hypothetical protein